MVNHNPYQAALDTFINSSVFHFHIILASEATIPYLLELNEDSFKVVHDTKGCTGLAINVPVVTADELRFIKMYTHTIPGMSALALAHAYARHITPEQHERAISEMDEMCDKEYTRQQERATYAQQLTTLLCSYKDSAPGTQKFSDYCANFIEMQQEAEGHGYTVTVNYQERAVTVTETDY